MILVPVAGSTSMSIQTALTVLSVLYNLKKNIKFGVVGESESVWNGVRIGLNGLK